MSFIPKIIKIRVVHAQSKNGPKYPAMDWTMPNRRLGQEYVGCILVRISGANNPNHCQTAQLNIYLPGILPCIR